MQDEENKLGKLGDLTSGVRRPPIWEFLDGWMAVGRVV